MGFFSFVQSLFKSSDKACQTDVPNVAQAPNTPDAEESFEMNSDAGHIVSIADLPLKSDSSVLDSRWPPFPRAVQVLSPKHLINAQAELVRNLCSAIPLSDDEVERYLMPVVWNLACFVHLLPASAHHHHRGLGGFSGIRSKQPSCRTDRQEQDFRLQGQAGRRLHEQGALDSGLCACRAHA